MVSVALKKIITTIVLICSLLCWLSYLFLSVYALTFQTPNPKDLKFLGEAHTYNITAITLTSDLLVPNSAAGRVLYNKPVTFRDTGKQNPASFNTSFSFSISTLNPNSIGGGLAFVITRDDEAIGDAGGNLGILPCDVCVEFDTFQDLEFDDVSGNHVGFNINSMISKKAVDLDVIGLSLRSGKVVNSWIDYSGSTKQLDVFISYGEIKPTKPVLSVTVDLYQYLENNMFVGFSGSTEGSTEIHRIISWNFTSFFDQTQLLGPVWSPPRRSMAPTKSIAIVSGSYSPTGLIAAPTGPTQTKCHGMMCSLVVKAVIGVAVTISVALVAYWQNGSIKIVFNNFCCSVNQFYNRI
ncbi:L-type lectin-domain containing receptor kinase VIII.1-like [Rutidosis leptorrhynchoides]|uniref:L-type lectin-domain containing receptor kinase VIII.1-like n=1 Tax=Rutidosis leptorrhynchoides TaxID=125765 RepID=UPI003A99DAF3